MTRYDEIIYISGTESDNDGNLVFIALCMGEDTELYDNRLTENEFKLYKEIHRMERSGRMKHEDIKNISNIVSGIALESFDLGQYFK